jgi:hypothetical protein
MHGTVFIILPDIKQNEAPDKAKVESNGFVASLF